MHTSAKLAVIFIEERVGKSPHVLAHHGAKLFLEVALTIWEKHYRSADEEKIPFMHTVLKLIICGAQTIGH